MGADDRDRSPRRDRRSGGGQSMGMNRPRGGPKRAPPERRVFISNIPFEMKWQEVKDMFRDEVGEVTYVELFNDETDKPRGCGILEFASEDLAKKAQEKMHRKDYKGRKLVVKEDFDNERDRYGYIVGTKASRSNDGGGRRGGGDMRGNSMGGGNDMRGSSMGGGGGNFSGDYGNTYGLSPQFLSSLGIDQPLHTRIFVANLTYTVDEKKLREVFRLAGRLTMVELNKDKEGKSRGHGIIEYTHPVEAVQAISMFNNQDLFERRMTVRFDKQPGPNPEDMDQLPSRLPEGLTNVGMGLGAGGHPLTNVAANLPSAQSNSNNMGGMADNSSAGNAAGNVLQQLGQLQNLSQLAQLLQGGNNQNNQNQSANNMMGGNQSMKFEPAGMGSNAGGNNPSRQTMSGSRNSAMGMAGPQSSKNNDHMVQQQMQMINQSRNNGMMGGGGSGMMGSGMMNSGMGGGASAGGMMGPGMMGAGGSGMGSGPSNMGGGFNSNMGGNRGGPMGGAMKFEQGNMGGGGGGNNVSSMTSDSVLIRNLPMECNWQLLREFFGSCGDIKYAEMKDRGIGMVRFQSERDAERAVTIMDKKLMNGRPIDVQLY